MGGEGEGEGEEVEKAAGWLEVLGVLGEEAWRVGVEVGRELVGGVLREE
jgi:hypothetical protein